MPIRPEDFQTGGALRGAVAESLVRQRQATSELAVGERVGIYRVLREIGRGGMAIVYLAARDDGEYEQHVALKWMQSADADPVAEALFRRERQALADLRHPHIARLLDGGRSTDGRPWFAMEFVDGAPLDRHAVERNLQQAQRLLLFLQVCAALAFAHARGVIHRDIKPSNVLVDSDGSAKLLDFGIAQLVGQDDELARQAYTPGFASPEQLRGEPLTIGSDVYQLGRLLASLLSCDIAEQATLHTLRASAASTTSLAVPERLSADLVAILRQASQDDPSRRHASADALAADVRAVLEHRPVSARPRNAGYVASRFVQRHPVSSTLGLLALLLLAGMATLFTQRLRHERDIAERERDSAQRERDAAESARAGTEAINRFLNEDLLDAANPLRRAPDAPDVTVKQALDQAEPRVQERFAGEPAIAASVLTTLGVLRYEFGEYDAAKRLYERALQAASVLPEADPVRLRARAEKAALAITDQDFATGGAEFEALVELGEREFGSDDARVLEWRLRWYEAGSRQGADVAFRARLEALAVHADRALGHPNWIAGEARMFIAQGYRMSGAPEDGAAAAERAHADLAATYGVDHPSTLKTLAVLAHGLQAQGHADRAIDAARTAFELQRARYGPGVIDTLFLQNEYGFLLTAVERYAEAETVFADLVEQRSVVWGRRSIQLVPPLSNLANVRMRVGRPADALPDIDRALSILDGLPDAPVPMRSVVLRGKADALRELGRLREARTVLDGADEVSAALPATDLRRLALQGSRARLLLATGDRAAATAMLDTTIAAMREQVADVNPMLKPLLEVRAGLDVP